MIDTSKYEGVKGSLVHSISNEEWKKLSPAAQSLVADAPLLLAEVKRLRGRHVAFMQWMIENYDEIVNEWEASE
tara:strand:+ start:120 stop:341 length:222 start_codon:yes stop_codon:yes gene_type:complete